MNSRKAVAQPKGTREYADQPGDPGPMSDETRTNLFGERQYART